MAGENSGRRQIGCSSSIDVNSMGAPNDNNNNLQQQQQQPSNMRRSSASNFATAAECMTNTNTNQIQAASSNPASGGDLCMAARQTDGAKSNVKDEADLVFNRLMALEAFRTLHPSVIRNLCSYAFVEHIDKGVVGKCVCVFGVHPQGGRRICRPICRSVLPSVCRADRIESNWRL